MALTGADLHLHTMFSDGFYQPQELLRAAENANLKAIALTDHDTIDGIAPLMAAAAGSKVEIIAGTEFSTQAELDEIHIVGLFLNYESPALITELQVYQERRRSRIYEICAKLVEMRLKIAPEDVFALAGRGAAGRVHVARAIKQAGYVRSIGEAFEMYLGNRAPAYVPKLRPSGERVIEIIHQAGGIAIMAHPGLTSRDDMLLALIAKGLDGVEVLTPSHSSEQIAHYENFAAQHGLLESAGSDFHGDVKEGVTVGCVRLPDDGLERMRARVAQLK